MSSSSPSSGLTPTELLGCTELLLRLPSAELAVLATQMRPTSTREDAVAAILEATPTIHDLLLRRPITKELINNYLDDKLESRVEVVDKTHGVNLLLQLWQSNQKVLENVEESIVPLAPAPSRNTSFSNLDSFANNLNLTNRVGNVNNVCMAAPSLAQILRWGPKRQTTTQDHTDDEEEHKREPHPKVTMTLTTTKDESNNAWSFMEESSNEASSHNIHAHSLGQGQAHSYLGEGLVNNLSPVLSSSAPSALSPLSSSSSSSSSSYSSSSSSSSSTSSELTSELTHNFVCWFYDLIRCQTLTSDAFWPDASTRISVLRQTDHQRFEHVEVEHDGSKACHALLSLLSRMSSALRPVGAQGGIEGEALIINVNGVVVNDRSNDVEIGRFEQQFGLIRDSSTPNRTWRIKFTLANLAVNSVEGKGDFSNTIEDETENICL